MERNTLERSSLLSLKYSPKQKQESAVKDFLLNLIGENTGLESMAMSGMLNLPGVASTTGQYNLLNAVPTGIYDRSISSANDYQAPIAIGTGIYDRLNVGSQLGGFLNAPSAATTQYGNIQSGIYNPMSMNFGNPANSFSNVANLSNQMLTSSQNNYANAQTAALEAGKGMATSFANFTDELGSWWDKKQGNTTSKSDGK